MFSSILPNASSTTKFVQNGHPKVTSTFRFAVLSLMRSISQNPSRFSARRLQLFPILWLRKWILDIALSNNLSSSDTFRVCLLFINIFRCLLKIWNPHLNSNHIISHDARSRTNNYTIYPGALNSSQLAQSTMLYQQLLTPLLCRPTSP